MDLAFAPVGTTVTVAGTAVQVVPSAGVGSQMRVVNLSASLQRFSWGTSSVAAPTGAGANTIAMLGASAEVFSFPQGVYFIAQTSTGFEFTPGAGV